MNLLKKLLGYLGIILWLSVFLACQSLRQSATTVSTVIAEESPALPHDSVQIHIQPQNLSEDLSLFSTKNDELLLLIYAREGENSLPEMIFHRFFLADTSFQSTQFSLSTTNTPDSATWVILLLEMDSDKSLEQIDPTIRIHFDEILSLSQQRDMPGLVRFLGKDDLLGMKEIRFADLSTTSIQFMMEGIQKMDKYAYLVQLKAF